MGVAPAMTLDPQDFWQIVAVRKLEPCIRPFQDLWEHTDGNLSCLLPVPAGCSLEQLSIDGVWGLVPFRILGGADESVSHVPARLFMKYVWDGLELYYRAISEFTVESNLSGLPPGASELQQRGTGSEAS